MASSREWSPQVRPREIPGLEPCPLGIDKLGLLTVMDIFRDLPEREIEALVVGAPMRTAREGTRLYEAEHGPEVLLLLKSGTVELYRQSPDGKKLTLAIVEEGTFFGEMSLLGQRLPGTGAVALEDSVICSLDSDDLRSMMLERPTVALRVIEVLASRLQQTRNALQEMAFNDLTGRVAGLLLRLADDTGSLEGYTHQDLAAMVGCLRESFTATLDRFKQTGAVTTGRKHVQITDRAQLERVVSQRSGVASPVPATSHGLVP